MVSPCGSGKTYTFARMAEACKGDVLILTHRRELLKQTKELLEKERINARVEMILTEANHLGEHPTPGLIIADEAHLSLSNSWMQVLDFYDTYTIGATATPVRLDGKPLGDVYQDMVEGVSVKWLIDHQRLAPFDYYAPTAVYTDNLKVSGGDYLRKDLEEIMDSRAIYSDILDSWKEIALGEKTIAYCVSIEHAKKVAETFKNAGFPAKELDASTPPKEREQIMTEFRNGEFKVLCNVGIISEGISIDDVTCCLLARPTESLALYWQQGQRAMRYLPGKRAKIIDCVGNYTRNPIFDMNVEWSLTQSVKKPQRHTADGSFTVRVCPQCFMTFQTADVCPFCGAEYPVTARELEVKEEIELRKITAEQAEAAEQIRKERRMEVGRARSMEELWRIARERGYKPGWVFQAAKSKHIL